MINIRIPDQMHHSLQLFSFWRRKGETTASSALLNTNVAPHLQLILLISRNEALGAMTGIKCIT